MSYVLLNATGEHAELQHEAWSAVLALVQVGTGLSCLTAVLLCVQTVIVQTDGDPAIREMTEELAEVRQKPTCTRTKAARSSQTWGAVESTIRQFASTDVDARCMDPEVWRVYRDTSFDIV